MPTLEDLSQKSCQPCKPGTEPIQGDQLNEWLEPLAGWELTCEGQRIRKAWTVKDFLTGLSGEVSVAQSP